MRYLGLLLLVVVMAFPQGRATVEVDTGNCALSGTFNGGIGFTAPDTGQGVGFQYPKYAPSILYHGSFLVGASATTVHDHHYGVPSTNLHNDWVVRDTFVDVVPPRYNAHELFQGSWVDTTRPTAAEGYLVPNEWGGRGDPAYDDFVIMQTFVRNTSTSTRTGVYVGIMIDFDLGTAPTNNWGRCDATRRLEWMSPTQTSFNPVAGATLLYPTTASNLAVIDHAIYVYPATGFTEQNKLNFLNGTIRLPNSTRAYDYSICVAAGPFTLAPGAQQRVAFAIVGAADSVSLKVNSDTAQAWFNRDWMVGVGEENAANLSGTEIKVQPNIFSHSTRIFYTLPTRGKIVIKAYDAMGREVATVLDRFVEKTGSVDWKAGNLPNGVYFLKTDTPTSSYTHKVLLTK